MTKTQDSGKQGRYACILYDSTFKVVICNPRNERLMMDIIELLIPGKYLSGISFIEKEKHGLVVTEKSTNFDLLCKEKDTGEEFLVELQNRFQDSYMDRMLAYATYPIRDQLEERVRDAEQGKKQDKMDYSLKPIYVVSMVNFSLEHEDERAVEEGYISRYALRNQWNAELMTPSLHFVFLEMGRLKLKPGEEKECKTLLEKFIFSMKYMHTMTHQPDDFHDPMLDRLYQATEMANLTVTEQQKYDKAMYTEIDRIAQNNYARKEGRAEGKAEGLAEGRAEGKAEERERIIKALREAGVPEDVIAKAIAAE